MAGVLIHSTLCWRSLSNPHPSYVRSIAKPVEKLLKTAAFALVFQLQKLVTV